MNENLTIIYSICYLALFVRLSYLWMSGFEDSRGFIESVKIVIVMMFAVAIASYVTSRTNISLEQTKGIQCSKVVEHLWSCGNFPVLYNYFGEILNGANSSLLSFMALPALSAPILANLYLARKVAENERIDAVTLLTAFGASFLVYFTLTHVPLFLDVLASLAEKFKGVEQSYNAGRKALQQWVSVLQAYTDNLGNYPTTDFPFWLFISGSFFALVVNGGAVILYLYQMLLVSLIPFSVFHGLLQDKISLMMSFRRMAAASMLSLLNGPLWIFLGLFPLLPMPGVVDGDLVFSDSDYYLTVGLVALGGLFFFVYYLLVAISSVKVVGDILSFKGE